MMKFGPLYAALALSIAVSLSPWAAVSVRAQEAPSSPVGPGYLVSFGDAERGRELFTGKGCVVCHSINGIGGKAGPSLDAEEMELGYRIDLTGQELADLARFIHDAEAQRSFPAQLPGFRRAGADPRLDGGRGL
jgi:mono/diheme cytochrome c family protein